MLDVKKIKPQIVYIIDAANFDGDIGDYVECSGNDSLQWYWIDDDKDLNEFHRWIVNQLPEDFTGDRILLEWSW